jgi:cystathionine beta-lyase
MGNFDTLISRAGTSAEKYTALERLFGREDILPFWVADMEFAAAPAIRQALAARVNHPVYGYTSIPESLVGAIVTWNRKRYGLVIADASVTLVPGVMAGVSAAIDALSEPGDAIVVQPPLYPPLMHTVLRNDRQLITNRLMCKDGGYCMNFD